MRSFSRCAVFLMRSCSASYESRGDLSQFLPARSAATRRAASAITALLKAVASARRLRRIDYRCSCLHGRHCGCMALVQPARFVRGRSDRFMLAARRDQMGGGGFRIAAQWRRAVQINSVVTVISSEGCHHRQNFGLAAVGSRFCGSCLGPASSRLLPIISTLSTRTSSVDRFPPSLSCHSRRLTSPDTATCVPLVKYWR